MKFLIGAFLGFLTGMSYGVFQAVELPEGNFVKIMAVLKGLLEMM
ncbi:hypothetical protein [Fictibacillus phosphorivorans]|nr:hypothetical protein [Fictibacillus phosphorivorans]